MRIRERFNPRAPCGARQSVLPFPSVRYGFQPTRPLRGATATQRMTIFFEWHFKPTRPLRGATILPLCFG